MSTSGGPNIIKDGLVFGYDTGYGVADNDTGTRFYPGKPTENLLGLNGANPRTERSGTSYPYYSSNIDSLVQARWSTANNQVTISFEGKRDYVGGGTGGGNDGYPVFYVYFSDWSWAATLGINSYDWTYKKLTFTMPNPSGKSVRFAIYHMNSGNRGQSYSRKHQIEFNSIATPFTDTSRSSTQSLIDLKKTRNIDVSNVSFDSNAQMNFDGTDDYVNLVSDITFKTTGGWTVESVVKYNSVAGGYNNTTSPANFIGADSISYSSWYWSVLSGKLALWNINPGTWRYGSTTLQTDTWYHVVLVSYDSGTSYQMYLNGVAEGGNHTTYSWNASYSGLKVRYIGRGNSGNSRLVNGKIPITKIYNRALSSQEVQQNYNAYKKRFGI
jgi:hypothetical protein